ncbi:MAG: SDR family oxidoreductase [Xanthomonadales bacterium]|nr:SDR family oxidoreductase [Xanthomonadales bacterium]
MTTGVKDRVALVTGAGRGIGKATVELLKAGGARVFGVARNERELAELGVDYAVADLGTAEGCARAVEEASRPFGRIDIFICNHGLGSAHEDVVWKQKKSTWRESMAINLDGPFYLSRLILAGMVERSWGRVVYTSSTAAQVAEYGGCAYNSAKTGLLGLMRSVARDAGPYGITSNAVLPGWVRTEMAERSARAEAEQRGITPEQVWEERGAMYPPGRVVTPGEVAATIFFLASQEASGISGQAISVALGAPE